MRNAGAIALAAPGFLVTAGLMVGLVLAPFGRHPMWPHHELNLSEAAAVRDAGEIVRLIEASEDPNAERQVRPGFLEAQAVRATPLEAAVAAKDVEIARILLVNGAAMNADVWNHLRCTAAGDEMTEFLDRRRPFGSALHCENQNSVEDARR